MEAGETSVMRQTKYLFQLFLWMGMFQVIACETERSSVLLAKSYYEVDCCSAVISCSIQQKSHRKKDEIFLK